MYLQKERKSKYDSNPELILRFREGDSDAGEELVNTNTPLVYSIAARFRDRGVDMSDLIECGTMGLVKAINTFDVNRGCAFSTYAVPLIFGEIRRFLRDDGPVKVSREDKRLCALLNRERERRLSEDLPCDLVSIAAAVGISPQDAASAMFSDAPVKSLDESVGDEDSTPLGNLIKDEREDDRFEKLTLRVAIESLNEEQRRLIVLRYFRDFSQTECAKILGMSQVKVSREEKKIMERLRRELT